ncbi:MAG: CoA transferase [Acidimicrobiales bacterium]
MDAALPLAGIRVIETACGVAGPYAAKLLGDLGAEVTKVEPADGDWTRRHGPFPGAEPDPDRSALFIHLNGAKQFAPGGADLAALLARADVWINDQLVDAATIARYRAAHPRLVMASLTPFGLDGPYAGYRADDIELYALGGPMIQTGVAEREPLKLAGNQIQYQWGAVGAVAIMGAVLRAEASGMGAHIDVAGLDTQMGSIDRQINHLLWRQWTGREVTRSPRSAAAMLPSGYFPCADGYVATVVVAGWLPRLLAVLDDAELTERCSHPDWANDPDLPGLLEAGVYGWLADRTRQQAMADGSVHRLPFAPFNGPADLHQDPHFLARGFFQDRDGDRVPSPPLRFHQTIPASTVPASTIPASTVPMGTTPTGTTPIGTVPSGVATGDPGRLPLQGVRVLDLTEVWSGPYATMLLGDLGAEIIRVDNPWFFPTITRGSFARPSPEALVNIGQYTGCYPDMDPGPRPWNRSGNYVAHSRSKKSCTLDLRRPLGRETFLRLVRRADVVIENASIGVMDKLGIGWDTLHEVNPQLVMVRMPSMGLDGPYRNFVGFGMHLEALGGSASLSGYLDADPSEKSPVYPMDPAAGTHAALATMAGLRLRQRTGYGLLVEVPQVEVILQHVGEALIAAGWSGVNPPLPGNRHVTFAPQGCYRCAGEDQWLVLSITDDEMWRALRTVMGSPAWAEDPRFDHMEGRRAHHDDVDTYLSEWTARYDPVALFHRCQAAGVAAAPVADQAAQLSDPHLRARGFFRPNRSSEVPSTYMPNHLWRWDGPPMQWGPFNRLGDHNDYVFRDLLGLADAEYEQLSADGHLSLDYLAPDGTAL